MNYPFKLVIFVCVTLSCAFNSNAQNAVNPKSTIDRVSVYLAGATVTRSSSVDLKAGENEIQFTGITSRIDPNSIQVNGGEGFFITGVRQEVNWSLMNEVSPEITSKRDSLDDIRFSVSTKKALRETYQEELAMLQANRQIGGKNAVLLVEDLEEMADFFRQRIKEIRYKMLELEQEERALNAIASRLQSELDSRRNTKKQNTNQIFVKVIAEKDQKVNMEFSYFVYDASWFPLYDLRSKDTESPIEVTYKAKIIQSTGNDWDNVDLTLTTGNPTIGGNVPNLAPWKLYFAQLYNRKDKVMSSYNSSAPVMYEQADEVGFSNSMQIAKMEAGIVEKLMVTEFTIPIKYDIPSDNQQYEVEMHKFNLPSNYRHVTVPKLLEQSFLTADVTSWESYNMLPGEAMIYFQGTYVGQSFIDPVITSDTLQLSLGRDPGVVVKREAVKDICKTTTFGGKKKSIRGFRTTVMNTRSVAVTVLIEDQVPLSSDSDIEVTVDGVDGAIYDEETGKVTWEVTIQPGASIEKILKYSVRYPRKKPIANL
ncbi:MAG: hypothetical protein ACJAU0_001387 [Flavobacteriales bacterium]|jgi:uncharacterized protein (TIGR02231 family)